MQRERRIRAANPPPAVSSHTRVEILNGFVVPAATPCPQGVTLVGASSSVAGGGFNRVLLGTAAARANRSERNTECLECRT